MDNAVVPNIITIVTLYKLLNKGHSLNKDGALGSKVSVISSVDGKNIDQHIVRVSLLRECTNCLFGTWVSSYYRKIGLLSEGPL